MHAQGLKDWGPILASSLPVAAQAWLLLGTLVGASEVDLNRRKVVVKYEYLDQFVDDAATRDKAVELLVAHHLVKKDWKELIVGEVAGIRRVDYYYLRPEAVSVLPPPLPVAAPAGAPAAPAPPAAGKMEPAAPTEFDDVKAVLNSHYLPFEADMLALRKQNVVAEVKVMVGSAVTEAEAGRAWTGPRVMQYLSALVTIKHKLEVVATKYTAKDLTIAKGLSEELSSRILLRLIPYFVFTYCDDPNDQWKAPTAATLLRNKTHLLTNYKRTASNATTSGRFTRN